MHFKGVKTGEILIYTLNDSLKIEKICVFHHVKKGLGFSFQMSKDCFLNLKTPQRMKKCMDKITSVPTLIFQVNNATKKKKKMHDVSEENMFQT